MCGIAGCVLPQGSTPDPTVLGKMARALSHRGPDDVGVEVVGQVGLVHTRLSIVDPSPAGHQPMRDTEGRWWLTYNGEVFNHQALRQQLPVVDWRSRTDTETVLRSLSAWSEEAVPRFNGLFAFAALDTARKQLLLARDRFGVKPLYLARQDGGIWYASEIGALFAAGISREARVDALGHALSYGWVNGARTPFRHVDRVAPGSMVNVDLQNLAMHESRWYDPASVVDVERMRAAAGRGRGTLRKELEVALRASVRLRLMSDVPVGTMCSGGVDSGLIAAFAADDRPTIKAYNASIVDQPDVDEGPWAIKVAAALGVELRTVDVTAESWRQSLVEVVAHNEYPLTHESSVPMAAIAELARSDGVKVLLSGEGADELFGGYEGLHRSAYEGFVSQGQVRRDRRQRARASAARVWRRRGAGVIAKLVTMSRSHPSATLVQSPPAPDAEYDQLLIDQRARAAYAHHTGARADLEVGLVGDLSTYLPHLLNRQDKATMQNSIETRVPFLDPDVVSLALNLPLEARVTPYRKGILRDLARTPLLPDGVAERPKMGFGFDVRRYLTDAAVPGFLESGYLRDLLEIPKDPWLRAVRGMPRPHILRFWTGEIWSRLMLEGQSVQAVESELWRTTEL
jgi:asparagine synthase (glutamine-hydrolysing)